MKKERFVNEALLLKKLPATVCSHFNVTEEYLDSLIDKIEEEMIIQKYNEINRNKLETYESDHLRNDNVQVADHLYTPLNKKIIL